MAHDDPKPIGDRRFGRFMMQVLWPAFLVSVVAEGLLFSMVDPHELVIVGVHLADSREAAYTVGFFVFWALFSLACGLTWILCRGEPQPPTSLLQNDDDRKHRDKSLIGR
jgi:hypothetical protein